MSAPTVRSLSKFFREHLLGVITLALSTGVVGNFIYDAVKPTSKPQSDASGPTLTPRTAAASQPEVSSPSASAPSTASVNSVVDPPATVLVPNPLPAPSHAQSPSGTQPQPYPPGATEAARPRNTVPSSLPVPISPPSAAARPPVQGESGPTRPAVTVVLAPPAAGRLDVPAVACDASGTSIRVLSLERRAPGQLTLRLEYESSANIQQKIVPLAKRIYVTDDAGQQYTPAQRPSETQMSPHTRTSATYQLVTPVGGSEASFAHLAITLRVYGERFKPRDCEFAFPGIPISAVK